MQFAPALSKGQHAHHERLADCQAGTAFEATNFKV